MKFRIILYLFFAQFVFSCKKPARTEDFLRFEQESIVIAPTGENEYDLLLDGNVEWAITISPENADWVQVNEMTGEAGKTLKLTAAPNTGASRTATITARGVKDPNLTAQVRLDQQTVNLQFVSGKLWGGAQDESAYDIAPTADGGYVVLGTTESNQTGDVAATHGDSDFWIARFNAIGGIVWKRVYGGTGADYPNGIAATSDGGFVVVGETNNDMSGDVGHSHGSSDIWLLKLNNGGDTLWTRLLGGSDYESEPSITICRDGGILVTGTTYSPEFGVQEEDCLLVKLSSTGNILWQKRRGGANYENAKAIVATEDNGSLLLASARGVASGDVIGGWAGYDYWLVRLNSIGDTVWTRRFGGDGEETPAALAQGRNGEIFIAGVTESSNTGQVGQHHGGTFDWWILKISSSGNIVWRKIFGGTSREEAFDIAATADGGCVVAGYSGSKDNGDVGTNVGGYDAWLVRFGSNGQTLWNKTFGGSGEEYFRAILLHPDGNTITVAGESNSSNSHDVNTANNGRSDWWIVTIKQY